MDKPGRVEPERDRRLAELRSSSNKLAAERVADVDRSGRARAGQSPVHEETRLASKYASMVPWKSR